MTHTTDDVKFYTLYVTANYPEGKEEEYRYQTAYEPDDLLGIMKTYMEYADKATSFVFVVTRESLDAVTERVVEEDRLRAMGQWDYEEGEHREEGTKAHFDRYVAGDR